MRWMFNRALSAAIVVSSMMAAPALAALIDFEGLPAATVVTNQFPGVTFSSASGSQNLVVTRSGIGFGDNFLCTGVGGSPTCAGETILTFANGVSALTFYQVGDDQAIDGARVALVDVSVGGTFAATVDILGDTNFFNPNLVDLSAFSNVTSIRIHDITDQTGLGWDNFSFTATPVAAPAVPEPETYAMLVAGLVLLSFVVRRQISEPLGR
jgi:hypothetical protein